MRQRQASSFNHMSRNIMHYKPEVKRDMSWSRSVSDGQEMRYICANTMTNRDVWYPT